MDSTVDRSFPAAAGGRLVLDDEAVERLVAALAAQLELVEGWEARARGLARSLPLGANPVGTAMAQLFSRRADGTDGSFVAVLRAYRSVLERSHDAARRSLERYREVERHGSREFNHIAQ